MKLPPEVLELLQTEKVCFLATSCQDRPQLSLMFFTYLPEKELIILSSRADTTKVRHIEKNPSVALLLYNLGGEEKHPVSCTLHGTASLASGEDENLLRERHLAKNKDLGVFIVSPNIKIITMSLHHVELVDIKDRVRTWTKDPA